MPAPDPEEASKLQDLSSGDMLKIQEAAYWLERRRAYHLIAAMKEARKTMPPRVALRDYRLNVDRCIRVLENFQAGALCHCNLYSHGSDFSLNGEVMDGFLTIEKETIHHEEYFTEYDAVCLPCGRRWQIKEISGYHYPTFEWHEVRNP